MGQPRVRGRHLPADVEGLAAEHLHAVLAAEEKGTASSAKMTRVVP
jgi:hypothetical protein